MSIHFDRMIETIVADALGIDPDSLPCFTVLRHDSREMVIVLHDEPHAGEYRWCPKKKRFVKL